jgi:hypothetical protein
LGNPFIFCGTNIHIPTCTVFDLLFAFCFPFGVFPLFSPDIPNRVANAAALPRAKVEELRQTMEQQLMADSAAAESAHRTGLPAGSGL